MITLIELLADCLKYSLKTEVIFMVRYHNGSESVALESDTGEHIVKPACLRWKLFCSVSSAFIIG